MFQSLTDVVISVSDHNGGSFVGSVDDQIMVGAQLFQCQLFFSGEIVCWCGGLCEIGDVSSHDFEGIFEGLGA